MEQWTFLWMCEHLARTARTLHWASGSKLCHHTLLYGIIPPFWHGILSLLGCQCSSPSPPPSAVGSAMLHPRHHPLFVSLRFSLARRQCPFLGTKYWREPHKRTNLSLFPHSRPPFFADHRGPTPTCNGYFFFVPSSAKFSVYSAFTVRRAALGISTWSNSEWLRQWYADCSCVEWVLDEGHGFLTPFLRLTLEQSSHFPIISSLRIDCESQTITSECK